MALPVVLVAAVVRVAGAAGGVGCVRLVARVPAAAVPDAGAAVEAGAGAETLPQQQAAHLRAAADFFLCVTEKSPAALSVPQATHRMVVVAAVCCRARPS